MHDPDLTIRALGPGDVESFVRLLRSEGESLGGSRSALAIRAVGRDATRRGGQALVVVADDGEVRAALVALIGGSWGYWRRFPLRHPVAGAHLAWRRIRKRLRSRAGRAEAPPPPDGTAAAPGAGATGLPEDLLTDVRLQTPMAPKGQGAPHLRDERPDVAFGALVVVAEDHRNQGLGKRLHREAFRLLPGRGVVRYDTSFLLDYEPSIRMYLSLGFDIYRTPSGYFGSYALDPSPAGDR